MGRHGYGQFCPVAKAAEILTERWTPLVIRELLSGNHVEYHLTQAGEELRPIVEQLGVWGQRWVRSPVTETDLDASLLMWDVRRRIRTRRLPRGRVVVHFEFSDAPKGRRHWWLILEPEGSDLCLSDPGFGVDLEVLTDVRTLTRIWMGDVRFEAAVRTGAVRLRGPAPLQRSLPSWLELSAFASVSRPAGSPRGS